jgi:hypothetical protein
MKVAANLDFQNASRIVNLPSPTSAGDAVSKSWVEGLVSTPMRPPSDLDCSTNPNYPAATAGDSYYVTVAGKVGGSAGKVVNVGDLIQCKTTNAGGDEASVGVSFYVLESNRDQATESVLGVVKIATQTLTNDGNDDLTVVTPLKLQTKINNAFTSNRYSTNIGNGVNSSFTITHNLAAATPHVTIRESASPYGLIWADVYYTDNNNISVSFTNPPTTNQYTVFISQ